MPAVNENIKPLLDQLTWLNTPFIAQELSQELTKNPELSEEDLALLNEHLPFLLKHHEYGPFMQDVVSGFAYASTWLTEILSIIFRLALAGLFLACTCLASGFAIAIPSATLISGVVSAGVLTAYKFITAWGIGTISFVLSQAQFAIEARPEDTRKERFQGVLDIYASFFESSVETESDAMFYLIATLYSLLYTAALLFFQLPYEINQVVDDTFDYVLFSARMALHLALLSPLYAADAVSYVNEKCFGAGEAAEVPAAGPGF